MNQQKCPQCLQLVTPDDALAFDTDEIVHLDCRRPRELSPEERALLFQYCWDHAVAHCPKCWEDFRQTELAADFFACRSHLCPRCRMDLTGRVREHIYNCSSLPIAVLTKARIARAAARRLVKESRQATDLAEVLMAEASALVQDARATLAALREAMGRSTSRGG
jgi:hypothetical protein